MKRSLCESESLDGHLPSYEFLFASPIAGLAYLCFRFRIMSRFSSLGLDELLCTIDCWRFPFVSSVPEPMRVGASILGIRFAEWFFRSLVALGLVAQEEDTCLFRALSRYALLQAMGLRPSFLIGINCAASDVEKEEGHAWVEVNALAILERHNPRGRHVPVFVYPSA
ncbi:MAG: lasso peptide biosynthesis protein [Sandaracinaceae bacterium]|nr:lasso peptide biosynthesis protein [Sandaracinaceae bacterium]